MITEKLQMLNQMEVLKDELDNLDELSVENGDIFTDIIFEIRTSIEQMEEKLNAR